MSSVLPVLVGLALVATVGILLTGVVGMARGGEFNRKYGNILMRARIVSQLSVVVLLFLYWMQTGD